MLYCHHGNPEAWSMTTIAKLVSQHQPARIKVSIYQRMEYFYMVRLHIKVESLLRKMPHAFHKLCNDGFRLLHMASTPWSDLTVAPAASWDDQRICGRYSGPKRMNVALQHNCLMCRARNRVGNNRQSPSLLSSRKTCQDRVKHAEFG